MAAATVANPLVLPRLSRIAAGSGVSRTPSRIVKRLASKTAYEPTSLPKGVRE